MRVCPSCGTKVLNQKSSTQANPVSPNIPGACPACGSTRLKRVQPGEYLCEFCGSKYYTDEPIVYVNIGTAFMNQGLPKEARPYYEKALSIIERDPASAVIGDIAVAYGSYALCLGRLGDKKNAVKYLAIAESIKNVTVFCA